MFSSACDSAASIEVSPAQKAKYDRLISEAGFEARTGEWLISDADRAYVKSLMHPVYERGKVANWIAAPGKGINGLPVDYEYVKPPDA